MKNTFNGFISRLNMAKERSVNLNIGQQKLYKLKNKEKIKSEKEKNITTVKQHEMG